MSEPRQHVWTGCKLGGHPANAESYEWVRYCKVCGIEDTCEDPLPPCVIDENDPIGWCSSCDSIWENCEFKIINERPACPNCGDWLIFDKDRPK